MNREVPIELGQAIGRLQNGYYGFRSWATALELGVVSALRSGPATASELASRTRTDERALARLLDALVAIGLLTKGATGDPGSPARYGLEPGLELYAENEPGLARHTAATEESWRELAAAVRDGKPHRRVDEESGEFFTHFVSMLFATNRRAAEAVAETLADAGTLAPAAAGKEGTVRVLDVGAGAGVWGLMLALRSPAVQVWALDRPTVLPITRRFFAAHGAGDRLREIAGDLKEVDLGQSLYDVILLGHILHSEGPAESARLIQRCARALKPRGTLVIGEFIADEARASRENPRPILFALHMFLVTAAGDTYTLSEMSRWCADAGLSRVRTVPVAGVSPVILAARA